ncbi:MAG TPA: YbaB/EbfC family nucleoid-associated protein, partial [Bryobacterales bacterium]|nr:YbaB/EbfC family nucleoid-associated protein [Bryobacterales bacterium]
MQKMMEQAQKMQEQLQKQIAEIRVEASTGGGMVTVKMDGQKKLLSIAIEPDAMEDREMLQDMIRGAVN